MKRKNAQLDNLLLSFREIWNYDKRLIFLLLADIFVSALRPFPNIFLSGKIVDSLAGGRDFSTVIRSIVLLFGSDYLLTAGSTFLLKAREYLFAKLTGKLDNTISRKCLQMDFELFNDSSVQDRVTLVGQAVRGSNFFTSLTMVFSTVSQLLTLIGIVCVMTTLHLWMLAIAAAVTLLQAVFHSLRLRHDRKYTEDSVSDRRRAAYVSQLTKDIRSKKDIVMFGMSDYLLKKIESFQQAMFTLEKRRCKEGGLLEMAVYSLSIAFKVSAYFLLGAQAFQGNISIGDFTVGVASLINFMSASSFVTRNIVSFNDNFFYIRQFKAFHKRKSKFDAAPNKVSLDAIDLSHIEIEFRGVSFRYPGSTAFVLKNINLKIKHCERLGIVGYNGAGKTTFTLLLTRMYDPTEGAIFLNGIDIREIDYKDYQKLISSVNQDFSLLAFSLLENIAIKETVTQEEKAKILELLNENGLRERMKKLYRGLDTPVTKTLSASGVDLSGGEMQKIAAARALYKNSPILLLDEPTSALDPMAEHEIFEKFAELSKGKTSILISHRIYSTRFCDKIAVFDKGELKEYGSFAELMELKGMYFDFYQQQAAYFRE